MFILKIVHRPGRVPRRGKEIEVSVTVEIISDRSSTTVHGSDSGTENCDVVITNPWTFGRHLVVARAAETHKQRALIRFSRYDCNVLVTSGKSSLGTIQPQPGFGSFRTVTGNAVFLQNRPD